MGANAKTSGKWASSETWKVVVINKQRRTRTPFYSYTPWAAENEAKQYMKSHKYSLDDFEVTQPVEVFKKGVAYDECISIMS